MNNALIEMQIQETINGVEAYAAMPPGKAKYPSIAGVDYSAEVGQVVQFTVTCTANTYLIISPNLYMTEACVARQFTSTPTRFYQAPVGQAYAAPFPLHTIGNSDFSLDNWRRYESALAYLANFGKNFPILRLVSNLPSIKSREFIYGEQKTNHIIDVNTEASNTAMWLQPMQQQPDMIDMRMPTPLAANRFFAILVLATEVLTFNFLDMQGNYATY